MSNEEIINKILEERSRNMNLSEHYASGYRISEQTGLLGNPTILEKHNNTMSEIKIIPSTIEERPLDKHIFLDPKNGMGMQVRDLIISTVDEGLNFKFRDGTYLSLNDFVDVLERDLFNDGPDTVYVAWKTGQVFDQAGLIHDIIKKVAKKQDYLKVKSTIKKNTHYEQITDVHYDSDKKVKTEMGSFVTDKKIDLGNGKYIFAFDLEKALTDYIKMDKVKKASVGAFKSPDSFEGDIPTDEMEAGKSQIDDNIAISPDIPTKPTGEPDNGENEPQKEGELHLPPLPPEPPKVKIFDDLEEPSKDEIYTVILRKGKIPPHILKRILPAIFALVVFLQGLGFDKEEITEKVQEKLEKAGYSFSQMVEIPKSEEELYIDNMKEKGVIVGEQAEVKSGTTYHESSDYDRGGKNNTGTFGEGIRDEGKYTVESISAILPDGTIVDTWKEGTELSAYAEEVALQYNLNVSDIVFRVHLTNPVAGWVNVEYVEGTTKDNPNIKISDVTLEEKERFTGTIENFNGNTITFNNGNVNVTINVVDENGDYLAPGTVVVGSDGEQYKVNELSVTSETKTTEKVVGEKNVLKFDFTDIKLENMLAGLSVAALGLAAAHVLNKKYVETAQLTKAQLITLIDNAARRYKNVSAFEKAVKKATGKKVLKKPAQEELLDSLISWDTTIEQIGEMKGSR